MSDPSPPKSSSPSPPPSDPPSSQGSPTAPAWSVGGSRSLLGGHGSSRLTSSSRIVGGRLILGDEPRADGGNYGHSEEETLASSGSGQEDLEEERNRRRREAEEEDLEEDSEDDEYDRNNLLMTTSMLLPAADDRGLARDEMMVAREVDTVIDTTAIPDISSSPLSSQSSSSSLSASHTPLPTRNLPRDGLGYLSTVLPSRDPPQNPSPGSSHLSSSLFQLRHARGTLELERGKKEGPITSSFASSLPMHRGGSSEERVNRNYSSTSERRDGDVGTDRQEYSKSTTLELIGEKKIEEEKSSLGSISKETEEALREARILGSKDDKEPLTSPPEIDEHPSDPDNLSNSQSPNVDSTNDNTKDIFSPTLDPTPVEDAPRDQETAPVTTAATTATDANPPPMVPKPRADFHLYNALLDQYTILFHFRPLGNAPDLPPKYRQAKLRGSRRFEQVVLHLRKCLRTSLAEHTSRTSSQSTSPSQRQTPRPRVPSQVAPDSLCIYVNGCFSPALDEVVANIWSFMSRSSVPLWRWISEEKRTSQIDPSVEDASEITSRGDAMDVDVMTEEERREVEEKLKKPILINYTIGPAYG